MQWWSRKKETRLRPEPQAPDPGTPGLVWPNCELPQSYLECPGGRCEGERDAARADWIDMCEPELLSGRAKLPQRRKD